MIDKQKNTLNEYFLCLPIVFPSLFVLYMSSVYEYFTCPPIS